MNLHDFDEGVESIDHIEFNVWGNEEILNYSALGKDSKGIETSSTYENSEPIKGGLLDARLGTSSNTVECATCGFDNTNCVGHFGHIKLEEYVYHVGYIDYVKKILNLICLKCSKLRIYRNENEIKQMLRTIKSGKERFDKLKTLVKKVSHCQRENLSCGAPVTKIKLEKKGYAFLIVSEGKEVIDGKETITKEILYPRQCYEILKNISDEDCVIMGINGTRPEMLIHEIFPVSPVAIRPSAKVDFFESSTKEDGLTSKLSDIVKANIRIKTSVKADTEQSKKQLADKALVLQYDVATNFKNDASMMPKSEQRGKPIKSISARLNGKDGRLRLNLLGKRTDYSARTVITSDPSIKINELKCPIKIAMNLTFSEVVTPDNIEHLSQLVQNGRDKYPGANFVYPIENRKKDRKSLKIDLRYRKEKIELKFGDIVERHLIDGDIVLLNRQPSLHKMSMMAHKLVINRDPKILTFGLNVSSTSPYNADFDGDEMNIFICRGVHTRIELEKIADCQRQIISPAKSVPIIGIVQDGLIGAYNISDDDVKIPWKIAMNILASTSSEKFGQIKKNGHVSGKELCSNIFPDDLNMNYNGITIKNGKFVGGQFTQKVLKSKINKSLIHTFWNEYGATSTTTFINDIQRITNYFNLTNGFSVGIGDIFVSKDDQKQLTQLFDTKMLEIMHVVTEMENFYDLVEPEIFELVISSNLSSLRDKAGDLIMGNLNKYNNLKIMVESGSKGEKLNIAQMGGCIGQQSVENSRIKKKINGRTLAYFAQNDDSPFARGFINRSFIQGADPIQFIFHNMASREGLIDTSIKSVTYDTQIIIYDDNQIYNVKIGEWIDECMNLDTKKITKENKFNSECLKLRNKIYIPTTDYFGNVSWELIQSVTRHDPTQHLFEIETEFGRKVTVADTKSLLVWNNEMNQFEMKLSSQVNIDDCMPVTNAIINTMTQNFHKTNKYMFIFDELNGIISGILFSSGKIYDCNLHIKKNKYLNKLVKDNIIHNYKLYHVESDNEFILFDDILIDVVEQLQNVDGNLFSNLCLAPMCFIKKFMEIILSINGFLENNYLILPLKNEKQMFIIETSLSRLGIFSEINNKTLKIHFKLLKQTKMMLIDLDYQKSINNCVDNVPYKVHNDIVFDKIKKITKIESNQNNKVYDLTVMETLNFCLANGLHVVDTAETGYIQRKLIKMSENIHVQYDNTVRNYRNDIVLFAYGGNGIDTTKQINVSLNMLKNNDEEIKNKIKFTNEELKKLKNFTPEKNDKYYRKVLKLRDILRKCKMGSDLNNMFDLNVNHMLGVDLQYIVLKYANNVKDVNKIDDPTYIIKKNRELLSYDRIKVLCLNKEDQNNRKSFKYRDEQLTKTAFKFALFEFMSPKICIFEHHFDKDTYDAMCDHIVKLYNKAVVSPGEMVGILSAQSIGEQTTQSTLSTFHFAGVKSSAMLGVPRIKEIMSLSKNIKTPIMHILIDEQHNNSTFANNIASHLTSISLKSIRNKTEVYYDDKPLDKESFTQIDEINLNSVYSCGYPGNIDGAPWLARIELDKEKMMEKNVTLLTIKTKFCDDWTKKRSKMKDLKKDEKSLIDKITNLHISSNYDNSDTPILHIRFNMLSVNYSSLMNFVEVFMENFKLKGILNVNKIDNIDEKQVIKFDDETGNVTKHKRHVIETLGINLIDIRYINGIDLNRTFCNDIATIYELFGIGAARNVIFKEYLTVLSGNSQHFEILTNIMTNNGYPISIDRHGMDKLNEDPLSKASFEKTTDILLSAAVFGQVDKMNNVSSRIMAGMSIKGGTGMCDVIFNSDVVKNSEYVDDDKNFLESYNEINESNVAKDVLDRSTFGFVPEF